MGWVAVGSAQTAPATPATTQPAAEAATMPASAPASAPAVLGRSDSGTGLGRAEPRSVWLQLLASMLVVAILGGIAWVVVRKVLPRVGVGPAAGRRVKVGESLYVGPRRRVLLLEVGRRSLLVADTPAGLTFLADVTEFPHDQIPV